MTTTFDSVALPHASKIGEIRDVLMSETVLLSGKRSIQSSTEVGLGARYRCLTTWAEYKDILDCVGSSGSLVTEAGETYTNCYISSIRVDESDDPGHYIVEVEFRQDTT